MSIKKSKKKKMKSYTELMKLQSWSERLEYLKTHGKNPGNQNRDIMNRFYKSDPWLFIRNEILERDLACDLGCNGMDIEGPILVHHINPITEQDVLMQSEKLYDPENLICVSYDTHGKIHYDKQEAEPYVERRPGDTKLW